MGVKSKRAPGKGRGSSGGNIIRLRGITRKYKMGQDEVMALEDVDLTVKKGELLSIMGPSGCGKTTLLNIIGCIDTPTSGSYHLNGRDVTTLNDRELTRIRLHDIGFIFQQFYLIPTLNAYENVELPMKESGIPRSERAKRIDELFELIDLSTHKKHRPDQLSGGQQQRVAIARALANYPSIVLADEPTGEIDSSTGEKIMTLLRKLNGEDGITLMLVTHNEELARIAPRVVRLKDGRIVK